MVRRPGACCCAFDGVSWKIVGVVVKLASKIVLLCLLSMVSMSVLFSYLSIRKDSDIFTQNHRAMAQDLAAMLAPRMTQAWRRGGPAEVADAVQQSSVEFRHVSARFVGFQGTSGKSDQSETDDIGDLIYDERRITVTTTEQDGAQHVCTRIPFQARDTEGALEVARPIQPFIEHARWTWRNSVFTLLGVSVLCIGVVVVGGVRMIGRPLNLLVEKTKRIGEGDFDGPINLPGNNELSELGHALNEMCEKLAEQTATIQAEAESRIQAEKQLRHADRLNTVGQLAAGVAHEMGTPLNVVVGRAELIAKGRMSEEEVRQSAATIKVEADRIAKVIRGLLDFARRDTAQRSLAAINAIVKDTTGLLVSFAAQKSIEVELLLGNGPFCARVDAGQLQQVFANLIMNAIQATPPGGSIRIGIEQETVVPETKPEAPIGIAAGEYVRVDVRDSGSGIADENQPHVFEPFFTTKDIGEGTGLGLSIAYGIVQDHEGWIQFTTQPHHGTCFSVFLPLPTQGSLESTPS